MQKVKSYAFRLTVLRTGAGGQALTANGVVQPPSKLSGAFTVNGQTVRVFTGPKGGFVRLPGKAWSRDPTLSVHPVAWEKVLAGVGSSDIAPRTGGVSWRGNPPPSPPLAGG